MADRRSLLILLVLGPSFHGEVFSFVFVLTALDVLFADKRGKGTGSARLGGAVSYWP